MAIVNHIPDLVAQKFGGEQGINLSQIQRETGLNYRTIQSWMKRRVDRIDFPTMNTWCKYLRVQPGDLFSYMPDQEASEPRREK